MGERLITSKSEPVFGGVYKLAAVEDKAGNIIPKIKISANPAKITTPTSRRCTASLTTRAARPLPI